MSPDFGFGRQDTFGDNSNPILQLATSLLGNNVSDESLSAHASQLINNRIPPSEVDDAMRHVILSRALPELADLVSRLAAYFMLQSGDRARAAEYHDSAANYLDTVDEPTALTNALWHYERARNLAGEADPERQINEASLRARLASRGIDQRENLSQGQMLCEAALAACVEGSPEWCIAQLTLAGVLLERAEAGGDALNNVASAIQICDEVQRRVLKDSPFRWHAVLTKARGLYLQGNFGVRTIVLYQEALRTCEIAHQFFTPESDPKNYLTLASIERAICFGLGELGRNPRDNMERVLKLAREAESICASDQFWLAGIWLDSANAMKHLVEWDPYDADDRLRKAVHLAQRVQSIVPREHINYPSALLCEANLCILLADRGTSSAEHLQAALNQLQEAKKWAVNRPTLQVRIAVTEATVRKQLAEHGTTPTEHLRASIEACRDAERLVDRANSYRNLLAITRAAAHVRLADFGVEPVGNLRMASGLYDSIALAATCEELDDAKARLDASIVLRKLSILGIDRQANLQKALSGCRQLIEALQVSAHTNPVLAEILGQAFSEMANVCATSAKAFSSDAANDLQAAIYYLGEARQFCSDREEQQAQFSLNEATFHLMLARISQKPSEEIEKARICAERAALHFDPKSQKWATSQTILADVALHSGKAAIAYERLAASVECLESTRRQMQNELDRISYAHTLYERYGALVRTCLELARTESTTQRDWTVEAWHWVHRAKAKSFLELLEGASQFEPIADQLGHVQTADQVLMSLRQLVKNGSERTLFIEFFALGTTELAIFFVPLWSDKGVQAVVASIESEFIEEVCLRVLGQAEGYDPAGDRLTDLPDQLSVLFDTVAQNIHDETPDSLLLSPHFFLNLLPLHAATVNGRPLIEQYTVSYLPSPTLAQHFLESNDHAGAHALLVGNPQCDLKHTSIEVRNIASTLLDCGVPSTTLLENEATTATVTQNVKNAAIVHLASHAVLEQDFPNSGIELADRRVTANDIMSYWDLSGTSLAFLSTCVSGLSITGPSDDFMAIARVFFYSGASTVVANLWSVSENAGEVFANNFYKAWVGDSLPLPQAFQRATLVTRELLPQPLFWASFLPIGLPDPPRPLPRN